VPERLGKVWVNGMLDAPEAETTADSKSTAAQNPTQGPSVADAVRQSGRSIAELAKYAGDLVSAKLDQLKLSIRTLILYAVLGVLGLFAAATIVIVSVVLLLVGAAHGLGAALGDREWLGDLILSVVILGAIAISLTLGLNKFKTASRRRTMRKYEDRRKQHGERVGY
jgi:hypothetical protein